PASFTQSLVEELREEEGITDIEAPPLTNERVIKTSKNKKIFILSNENSGYGQGDFITLLIDKKLVSRALVAKVKGNMSGIKILKIYDLDLWKELRAKREVQVLRGDDSYFINLEKRKSQLKKDGDIEDNLVIKDDDDLFDSTNLDDDIAEDDDKLRLIKPDNLVGAGYGQIDGVDETGSSQSYSQINFLWGYQISNNLFLEGLYGQNIINDFPSPGLDTEMRNFTFRVKYTFNAVMGILVMPYAGYQAVTIDSPGAGQQDSSNSQTEDDLNRELDLVEQLEKNTVIFGATLLKRLVPGWFLRADLGTDILSVGISVEF
ncbi:MAG: porin family protein, partial [Bdellovibrionales bacterium]|nr:porin family protein [Bdellovibrionales bacterium]